MNPIQIVTDSVADLTPAMIETLGVTVLPLTIRVDGVDYEDGLGLTAQKLFRLMDEGALTATTSQVSPAAYEKAFRKILEEGKDILCLCVSAKVSGTYQSACLAAREFPQDRIRVVDTMNVTAGEQLLVHLAHQLCRAGKNLAEIEAEILTARQHIANRVMLKTLDYLKRGGRISATASFVGGVLGIRPILQVKAGEVISIGKERSEKKGLANLLKALEAAKPDPDLPVILVHARSEGDVAFLKEHLDGRGIPSQVIHVGAVVGNYIGPSGIAWFLLEETRS